ncbi:MAG: hypothetical protein DWI11_07935 [Planctomycetota bacterium]|nr:MAG: hypothetical protein DWI11_07935 [Planctomycetota bacterium]
MNGGLGHIDVFAENAVGQAIATNPTLNQADLNLIFAEFDAALLSAWRCSYARFPNQNSKLALSPNAKSIPAVYELFNTSAAM